MIDKGQTHIESLVHSLAYTLTHTNSNVDLTGKNASFVIALVFSFVHLLFVTQRAYAIHIMK